MAVFWGTFVGDTNFSCFIIREMVVKSGALIFLQSQSWAIPAGVNSTCITRRLRPHHPCTYLSMSSFESLSYQAWVVNLHGVDFRGIFVYL